MIRIAGLCFIFFINSAFLFSQHQQTEDSLRGFSVKDYLTERWILNLSEKEQSVFINNKKREFIQNKYFRNTGTSANQGWNQPFNQDRIMPPGGSNIDFEQGNFNGWTIYTGLNYNSTDMLGTLNPGVGSTSLIAGGTDTNVPLSLTSPLGGNFIARVNYNVINAQQGKIQNKLFVTPDKNLLKFAYACVFQAAGHDCSAQPYFAVTLRDTTGNILFKYLVIAPDSAGGCKGYNQSYFSYNPIPNIYYTNWRVKCVDLSPYVGNNIFVEVTGASCTLSGHYGYGYFDAKLESCPDYNKPNYLVSGTQTISLDPNYINVSYFSCQQNTITNLTAPSWPSYYNWNGPSGSYIIASNAQSVNSYKSGLHTLSMGNSSVCPITKSIYVTNSGISPTLGITGSSSVCLGGSVSFTATGANTYTWSNNATGSVTALTPTAPGVYTISFSSQDIITQCIYTSAVLSYTIYNSPNPTSVSGNTLICQNTPATFTASGGNTYSWYGVNMVTNATSTAAGAIVSFTPSASTRYTVTAFSPQGCTSPSAFFTVTTIAPNPYFNATTATPTVCAGNTVNIVMWGLLVTHTVTDGVMTSTYAPNANIVVTPTATTTYTVFDGNACSTPSVMLTIYTTTNTPTVTPVASGTLCSLTFTLGVSGASVYTWDTPMGTFTGNTNSFQFYNGISGIYSLTGVYFNNGCVSATQTVNVNITQSPQVSLSPSVLCSGIVNTVVISGGGPVYSLTPAQLYTLLGPTFTTSGTFTVNPPINQTTYSVNTVLNGCGLSPFTFINCPANSPISINIVANSNSVCTGGTVNLAAYGAPNYSWSTGSTSNNINVSPTVSTVYSVTSTNACGIYSQSTSITYVNAAPPSLSIIANNYSPCVNTVNVYTATGAATYTWAGGLVSPTKTAGGASFTLTVSGTATTGCLSTTSMVINSLPLQTPTISGNATVCPGNVASFSASGLTSYSWNTGSTSYSTNFNAPGTLILNGIGPNGCSANTVSQSISVYNPAFGSVSVFPAGSISLCPSSVLTLSLNDPGSVLQTYTWSTGAINIPTISISPSVTTTYSLYGTTAVGCSTTFVKTIYVYPLVTPSFICSSNTACLEGSSINFTLSPVGSTMNGLNVVNNAFVPASPGTFSVFASYGSNGCLYISSSQTITVFPSPSVSLSIPQNTFCLGNNTVMLTGSPPGGVFSGVNVTGSIYTPTNSGASSVVYTYTDVNGCTDYDHICVDVISPTITISGTNSICAGQSCILTASGAISYSWSNGATTNSILVSPTVSTTYSVVGANTCSSSAIYTVNVNTLPTLTVTASNPSICTGNSGTLSCLGASTYSWSNGNTGSITIISPTSTTIYTVTATSINGCQNTATVQQGIYSLPNLTLTASDTLICAGESVLLSCFGANSYSWSNGGTGSQITVSPIAITNYTVTGTDINGCISNSVITIYVNTCTNINADILEEKNIKIFPNPTEGQLTIKIDNYKGGSYTFTLYNVTGNLIFEDHALQNETSINLKNLSGGIYFLKIGPLVKKVIKE